MTRGSELEASDPHSAGLCLASWRPPTAHGRRSSRRLISLLSQSCRRISEFSLERVGRSGAKYDYTKMKWFNQQHLRLKTDLELFNTIVSVDDSILNSFSKEYILNVISLVKEREGF